MGIPLELRNFYVNKPLTSNVTGNIWEIQAISTKIFVLAQTLYNLIYSKSTQ